MSDVSLLLVHPLVVLVLPNKQQRSRQGRRAEKSLPTTIYSFTTFISWYDVDTNHELSPQVFTELQTS